MICRKTLRRLRLLTLFSLICCTLFLVGGLLCVCPLSSSKLLPLSLHPPTQCSQPINGISFKPDTNFFSEDNKEKEQSFWPGMLTNGNMHCDRSSFRSDVCYMKGEIRSISLTNTISLYTDSEANTIHREEKIKPYTRKWEQGTMNTIDELTLIKTTNSPQNHVCDVRHSVPAIFFSTGGFTGNVYHEFNDGIIPLYITSHVYNKDVVFLILEYHDWWMTKYGDIVSQLSNYDPIDFTNSRKSHCFSEAIVGLNIHDQLTVNTSLMQGSRKGIADFRKMLDDAYMPRIQWLRKQPDERERITGDLIRNPKLVIISRTKSQEILNQESLVRLALKVGFRVQVLLPTPTTELAEIYRSLNSSDVMVGVHGAAMTHFLFMRPGTVFIQVVPLGTDWAAQTYYGDPAIKLGLRYVEYKILPSELSLSLSLSEV